MQLMEILEKMASHAHFHPSLKELPSVIREAILRKDAQHLKNHLAKCALYANATHIFEL